MTQRLLRKIMLTVPDIALQRDLEVLGAIEVVRGQNFRAAQLQRCTMPLVCGALGLVKYIVPDDPI